MKLFEHARAARGGLAVLMAVGSMLLAAPAFAQDPEEDGPAYPHIEFSEGARDGSVTDGPITARIVQEPMPAGADAVETPELTVSVDGKAVLRAKGAPSGLDEIAADAMIAEIDPANAGKEVYFSSYTGGAHCCSQAIVATETEAGWTGVEIGTFDGDGDYLRDVDGDGVAEIVTVDNRFLYAFDCYACSAAPLVVYAVRAGVRIDVTAEPRFLAEHRAWLAQLESDVDPENRWTSPGFVAGWVAAKARVGEGGAAMAALRSHWDSAADEGEETCLSGDDIDACPRKDRKLLKFPDRLALFLKRTGYPI
ncbi:hypothetical protein [Prosthecomicrobium pneumaticum]|uniref:VCBS repeat-containing protein n=1 Tax=Prosthecomicrobium pneumaticum TaxID=81895 RepID=A0A7W9FK94_9HYPH|nr:hypothetical protein [Prosthecomicrobium pneumaticum]MBB5752305.1 hypothetical protein [Prosthecomicrobium pneumaticum]